jgi:hypothetical protein
MRPYGQEIERLAFNLEQHRDEFFIAHLTSG